MTVVSVVFDVGETLLDDSREFGAWADWIGVPRHTFSAVLGAVTAAGRDNAETFQYFRPGFDLARERERREQAGAGENYTEADLYPDVRRPWPGCAELACGSVSPGTRPPEPAASSAGSACRRTSSPRPLSGEPPSPIPRSSAASSTRPPGARRRSSTSVTTATTT